MKKIQKASVAVKNIKVLLYGAPGVGKTFFCSTAPSPLLIDTEGGLTTLAGTDVATYSLTESSEAEEVFWHLREEKAQYKTICLDTLSNLQHIYMRELIGDAVKKDPNRDGDLATLREWGRNNNHVAGIADMFCDLGTNVIFVCHERERQDDDTGQLHVLPNLSPALSSYIMRIVDAVVYLYTKTIDDDEEEEGEVKRSLLIQPTGRYVAKVRVPVSFQKKGLKVPLKISDPTFEDLSNLILKGVINQ